MRKGNGTSVAATARCEMSSLEQQARVDSAKNLTILERREYVATFLNAEVRSSSTSSRTSRFSLLTDLCRSLQTRQQRPNESVDRVTSSYRSPNEA
jgi:hypothetical protein